MCCGPTRCSTIDVWKENRISQRKIWPLAHPDMCEQYGTGRNLVLDESDLSCFFVFIFFCLFCLKHFLLASNNIRIALYFHWFVNRSMWTPMRSTQQAPQWAMRDCPKWQIPARAFPHQKRGGTKIRNNPERSGTSKPHMISIYNEIIHFCKKQLNKCRCNCA